MVIIAFVWTGLDGVGRVRTGLDGFGRVRTGSDIRKERPVKSALSFVS